MRWSCHMRRPAPPLLICTFCACARKIESWRVSTLDSSHSSESAQASYTIQKWPSLAKAFNFFHEKLLVLLPACLAWVLDARSGDLHCTASSKRSKWYSSSECLAHISVIPNLPQPHLHLYTSTPARATMDKDVSGSPPVTLHQDQDISSYPSTR